MVLLENKMRFKLFQTNLRNFEVHLKTLTNDT